MTDRPIIFSAPMVRALLEGRKTMTRRLADREVKVMQFGKHVGSNYVPSPWQNMKPGDFLWAKETHYRYGRWVEDGITKSGQQRRRFKVHNDEILFTDHRPLPADLGYRHIRESAVPHWWLRPAIYQPRTMSRLTLLVTAVKIERLQDISEEGARAEGIYLGSHHGIFQADPTKKNMGPFEGRTAQEGFANLWCEIHGQESWSANPFVVALTFMVHKTNIDQMADAA